MPYLLSREHNRMVLVNFKVMSSSLKQNRHYEAVSIKRAMGFILSRSLQGRRPPMLIIVRNPYARLVSFFEDKFRKEPGKHARPESDSKDVQECQRIFLPHLDIHADAPHRTIWERLVETPFSTFMEILPEVYQTDRHLWPQSRLLEFGIGLPPRALLRHASVVRLEELDADYMKHSWKIDCRVRANATEFIMDPVEYFSPQEVEVVNRLYQSDFELFGYPCRDGSSAE